MSKEFVWVERYRPETVSDLILPAELKAQFEKFVEDGDMPNLLLVGPRGMGKTSAALAVLNQIGVDYIKINGSLERNMDMIRDRVQQFVSSVSFTDSRKFVLIDEADGLNPLTQPALKAFIEEFSHNAGFILTANHLNKIIPELQSRTSVVEFKIPEDELPKMCMAFMKRMEVILKDNDVSYEKAALAAFIKKWFPDWRRIINELQRYATKGTIDTGILAAVSDETVDSLIALMKAKDWNGTRQWVAENGGGSSQILRTFYDRAETMLKEAAKAEICVLLARYNFQGCFAVDQEVNNVGFFTEAMMAATWK